MMAIEFCGIKAKANFPIPMDEINQIYIQINTTESSNVVVVAAIEVEVKAVMVESTSPLNLSLKCSSGGGGGDGDFVAIVGELESSLIIYFINLKQKKFIALRLI